MKYRRKGLIHKDEFCPRGSWSIALGGSWTIVLGPSCGSWLIVLGSPWGPWLRVWPPGRGEAGRLPWTPWWSPSTTSYCLGSSGRWSCTSPAKTVQDVGKQVTPHSNLRGLGECDKDEGEKKGGGRDHPGRSEADHWPHLGCWGSDGWREWHCWDWPPGGALRIAALHVGGSQLTVGAVGTTWAVAKVPALTLSSDQDSAPSLTVTSSIS